MTTKLVTGSGRPKPPAAGKGRPKGSVNKVSAQLKDMILGALDNAGGVDYLTAQANDSPSAFLALIGKVLPTTLAGHDGGNLTVTISTGVPRGSD